MSWKSGTDVAVQLWEFYKENLPEELLKPFAENLVKVLRSRDWDGPHEIYDLAVFLGEYIEGTCACGEDAGCWADEFDGKCWDCKE